MPAWIHHLATEVPEFAYEQSFARDRMKQWILGERNKRVVHALYDRSGIERRYSVVGDFLLGREPELYKVSETGAPVSPGTAERNAIYARASRDLAVKLARKALDEAEGFTPADITHIVFASCTGFANPGPDYHIIRELELSEHVQRYTLGFMGCYAAFPALRMAAQFCQANPNAVVLVMCLELCTLHMQINEQPDSMLANTLFADGAAAAIVSGRPPLKTGASFRLREFASSLVTSGEQDMAWDIGNNGFNIVLSSYVPDIIGGNIRAMLDGVLGRCGLPLEAITRWAVHPGGRAILDRVQDSLGLPLDALDVSRQVLRQYGNMSSATVMFVLAEMLARGREDALVCAMAFGPGLTVETAVLELVAPPVPAKPALLPALMGASRV